MENILSPEESIYDKLKAYAQSDAYPFHMPGHKRKLDMMSEIYQLDITEIDDFDDLHHASGMLKDGMERLAAAVGARKSYYIVNGSTCGILAALYGACRQGAKVAVARNTHKSVAHGIILRNLNPIYIYPQNVDKMCISGEIINKDVENAYKENPDISAVVITSPTYEGIVSDIRGIAGIVHAHGGILIVDEAHGAHLPYAKTRDGKQILPYSAVNEGADIVIQSLHKTLPCLTQSAALHICSDRVNEKKIERALCMFETSSPSYVLMAGMDLCVCYMEEEGQEKLYKLCKRLDLFYERAKQWTQLWFLYNDVCKKAGDGSNCNVKRLDYTKLVFGAKKYKGSGRWLHEVLREKYHLQPEMSTPDYVLLMTMLTDTEEGFERLEKALEQINKELEDGAASWNGQSLEAVDNEEGGTNALPVFVSLSQAVIPSKAAEAEAESIPFKDAVGRISTETAYVYPPGCPFLMPGEKISKELIELIEYYRSSGMELYGTEDESGENILVME